MEYIVRKVNDGEISKNEALNALKKCLEKKIVEYENASTAEASPGSYWIERLTEARKAMKSIVNNLNVVIFRDTELQI